MVLIFEMRTRLTELEYQRDGTNQFPPPSGYPKASGAPAGKGEV